MSADAVVYSAATAAALTAEPRRLYVLYGPDDVQKAEAAAALRAALVDPDFADFDADTLDLRSGDAFAVLASAGQSPLGSGRRLVVAGGGEALRRRERSADLDALMAGLAGIGPATSLVLIVGAGDEGDGQRKTAVSPRFDRAAAEVGVLVRCSGLGDRGLMAWLQAEASAAGKRLDTAAAERLVQAARGDRRALSNELEKAICFAGEARRIDAAMAAQVVSHDAEDVMFRLVDAVGHRNGGLALALLQELLRHDPRPQSVAGRLLAVLGRQLKLLWQAREFQARRVSPGAIRNLPANIQAEMPREASLVGMAWKAGDLYAMARKWSREGLAEAYELVTICDLANKGGETGSADAATNLQVLLARLATVR